MKKQFIIALAVSICTFSFAQKKELKNVEKAIKNVNFSEAKAALNQAKALMASMDEKSKNKYYYLFGKALYANGAGSTEDIDKALESLSKVKGAYKDERADFKEVNTDFLFSPA